MPCACAHGAIFVCRRHGNVLLSAAKKVIDKRLLKGLVPINALAPPHFNEIADKISIEDLPAGRVIFKEGERDNRTVYLLAGEINLFVGAAVVSNLSSDADLARHPLAPQQPRQHTAKAKTPVTIARIDTGLLDVLLTWDQSTGYEVTELEAEDEDWLSRMLQSQTFQKLPAANIQKLLMSMEEYPAAAGSVVIKQGDPGDYYYIIKQGRCAVTRKAAPTAQDVKLAELSVGDSFGEDALISDSKRNATITMLTDGRLMRLAKKDFVALLREPLLAAVSFAQAQSLVRDGAAWLDVRLPGEFQNTHIPGSINIPLAALRHRMNELANDSGYIVYCDNGGRSSTAAFLLSQHGYEVRVLQGGTQALVGAEALAVQAAKAPAAGAEVISFDQEVQARKKSEEAAAAPARAEASQVIAQARAQAEQLKAEAQQILRQAEHQAEQVRNEATKQLAQRRAAQSVVEQADARQQTAVHAELLAERDAARQSLAAMSAAHQQLSAQLTQLQQTLQSERDRAAGLAGAAEQSDSALTGLRAELNSARQEARAAEQARHALSQELSVALAQLQQTEQQTATQHSEAQRRLEQELAEMRVELHAAQGLVEQTQQELQEQILAQDEKIMAMKTRLESAREQALEGSRQKADLEAARDAAQQRATELQVELTQAQALQAQLSSAEQAGAAAQTARLTLEQEVLRLRNEIEQARQGWRQQEQAQYDELAAAQQLLAAAQAQTQTLQQSLTEQEQARSTQHQQLLTLQEQLAKSALAEQRVSELTAALEQLQAQRLTSDQQQQNLGAERQTALEELAALRAALAAQQAAAGAQTAELNDALAVARAELLDAGQAAAAQLTQLHAERAQQQTLIEAQVRATTELAALHTALENKERDLTAQLTQLSAALAQAQTEQTEQAQLQQRAAEERAQLRSQFERLQTDSAVQSDTAAARLTEYEQTQQAQQAASAAQLTQLTIALAAQTSAAAQAETQLTESRAEREALQNSLQSVQAVAAAERDELQVRIQALQDDAKAALTRSSNQAEAKIAELQAELAAAAQQSQRQVQGLRGEVDSLHETLAAAHADAQREADQLPDRIASLQREADAAVQHVSAEADARVAALAAQLVTVQETAERETQNLRARSVELQDALQNANVTANAEREALRARIAALETEAQAALLQSTLEADGRLVAELAKVRGELEADQQAVKAETSRLREQLAEAEQNHAMNAAQAQQAAVALSAEQQRLRDDLAAAQQQVSVATSAQAQLQTACDGLKADLQRADVQLNAALRESDGIEASRSQADNEIVRLTARIQELESAAQHDDSRGGKAEKKHAAALGKLRTESASAQAEAERQREALQAQLDHAMQQGQEADARFARQQAQVSELEAQLDQGRRCAAQLVADVEDLKRQLEEQTQLRLAAEKARKATQQEADGLRAESQIMSNLGEDHIEASAAQRVREQQLQITRLEGELLESKKNVDVAVRLRAEAESARQAFEEEMARIKAQANQGAGPTRAIGRDGFTVRGAAALGLAAGWLAALALGTYLLFSGARGAPPGGVPETATAVTAPAQNVAPATLPVPASVASVATSSAPPKEQAIVVHALGTFRDNLRDGGSGPLMARLPAADYAMGSAANSLNFDETPRHKVSMRAFAIGSYEVSFADYDRFATATGRPLPGDHGWGRDNRPVINVSWDDAQAYVRWLSEQTGHRYRLPSEAEWEYAAAAGTSTFYWWGNNSGENRAACFNCGSRWDGRETAPVGSFAANAFGLYDTAGNVLEWVADCRHEGYQNAPADGSVWAGGDCTRHVARGGGFDSPVDNVRTQSRPYFASGTRLNNLGLRVVRED